MVKQVTKNIKIRNMKKVLLLLVCAVSVVACTSEPIEGSTKIGEIGGFSVIIIDGCEYLEYRRGGDESRVYSLTHKGNCKNHEKSY